MKLENRLCQNILKYNKNTRLTVSNKGVPQTARYYCTTADLLNNSKFIRYAAIGDGSCLLHAIATSNKQYMKLRKSKKEEFIAEQRRELAKKILNIPIDKLFTYFGPSMWYIIMDGDAEIIQQEQLPISHSLLSNSDSYSEFDVDSEYDSEYDSESDSEGNSDGNFESNSDGDYEELSVLWQAALRKIDQEKIFNYAKMKTIIIEEFGEKKKDMGEILDKGIMHFRNYYYNWIMNPSQWLGAREYLFLSDQLMANLFILRFNQYGIVYIQESGDTSLINSNYNNNYILAWNENHYELVGIQNKKKKITTKFLFTSPIIKMLVKLSSHKPLDVCKKYPLLSMFYNDNPAKMNMTFPFLFPLEVLKKKYSPQKAPIAFTKSLVRKIKKTQDHQYITKCLQFIIKKYNFILVQSFATDTKSDFWKKITKQNISRCFSQAEFSVNIAPWVIEVSRNGEQLAIACLAIDSVENIRSRYKLDYIQDDINNIGFIYNLCTPERYRRQGHCKKLMQEVKYLINLGEKNKHSHRSRRSRIRDSLKRKNALAPKAKHIKNIKITTFYLEVYKTNLPAIKCYTSIDFIRIAEYVKNNKKILLLRLD